MQVTININGTDYSRYIEPRRLLVHFIRDDAKLTGTHWGCDTSNCGVCTVLMDGQAIKSCTTLAVMAEGHDVLTVEGMEVDGVLDPVETRQTLALGIAASLNAPIPVGANFGVFRM